MPSPHQILAGLAFIGAGIVLVKYTLAIRNFTGPQDWLERYTGPGTTYGIYKLLGVFLAFFGILVATGIGTPLLVWLLSPFRAALSGLKG